MTSKRIYLDHNASSPLRPVVFEAMRPFYQGAPGNASGVHEEGRRARTAVDRARGQVASLIGAQPDEIVFTGGGTEANNLAIFGVVAANPGAIVTSAVEHKSVLDAAARQREAGGGVHLLPADGIGRVRSEALPELLGPGTSLVSVMTASNEVGTIQPVAEIAAAARARGVLVHSDAVQAAGRIPLDVDALGVDLLSLSAHKLGGPQGVGALYVRRGVALAPRSAGGPQERNRRAGTENVPGIVGFGAACEAVLGTLSLEAMRQDDLRQLLLDGIRSRCEGVTVNGDPARRLPNTLNLCFEGADAGALEIDLDLAGVAVSRGSACVGGEPEGSHVLRAMGLSPRRIRSALRLSLGYDTTREDVTRAAKILAEVVDAQRRGGVGELVMLETLR
jgi:cysteine desulfurase